MAAETGRSAWVVRVSPRSSLLRNGLLSFLLVSVPVFGALFFLGLGNGSWLFGVIGEVVGLALAGGCYLLYRRTFIGVTASAVVERGFVGRLVTTPLSAVDSVVFASVYSNSVPEPVAQLIALDANGCRLLRMRGSFWANDAIRSTVDAIGLPVTSPPEDLTFAQFFAAYPGSAYWFENRPLVIVVALAIGLAVVAGLVFAFMSVLGLPVSPN